LDESKKTDTSNTWLSAISRFEIQDSIFQNLHLLWEPAWKTVLVEGEMLWRCIALPLTPNICLYPVDAKACLPVAG
jgi:hypothetical protein